MSDAITIPAVRTKNTVSKLEFRRRSAGLKYLNGERYLRNSKFLWSPEMMDMK